MAHTYDPRCCPEVYFALLFARESARRINKYDQICCSEVYFVLFFARESAHVAHTYGPRFCPELYFVLFFDREGGGVLAWCRRGSWLAPGRLGEGVFINREHLPRRGRRGLEKESP